MKETEYDQGFNKGGFLAFVLTFVICVSLVIFSVLISFYGDTKDRINTEAYGKILCNQYGLEYSHRTLETIKDEAPIPKIYCKKANEEKKIIDNILLLKWNIQYIVDFGFWY